jgi:ABC-2 type transport system ATP-binding protein
MPTDRLTTSSSRGDVLVRSPQASQLAGLLAARGAAVTVTDDGGLAVAGLAAPAIADLAAAHGVPVHELMPRPRSLEQAYLELTGTSTEYHAVSPDGKAGADR